MKLFFLHKWFENLHGFANICKLPVAKTFKVMQSKICLKVPVVFQKYFKFWFLQGCKKVDFNVPLVVQISIFLKTEQKVLKNLNTLRNDGHFRIPHPQISL